MGMRSAVAIVTHGGSRFAVAGLQQAECAKQTSVQAL
jgi:hypothetical protein